MYFVCKISFPVYVYDLVSYRLKGISARKLDVFSRYNCTNEFWVNSFQLVSRGINSVTNKSNAPLPNKISQILSFLVVLLLVFLP